MKCFYHADVDGKCSGAIVNKFVVEPIEFIQINYNNDFPFDSIEKGERIIIVDFSLQKEGEFDRLREITNDITWIDHHKSAIEKHPNMTDLAGIRDISKAGCELTWNYFYPEEVMPLAVKYSGRYDVWDFSEYGETLNNFQTGIRLYEHKPQDEIWESLLDVDVVAFLERVLSEGEIALKFRTNRYSSLIRAFSFFADFEGYKAICCNVGATSSQLFDSIKEDYDLMMPFVWDGNQWTVSIYSTKDIDCSELAKKYGGGGHKGAAGFQCKELPIKQNLKGDEG